MAKDTKLRGMQIHKLADKSDPAALDADLPGAPPGTWPLADVVHRGGAPERTHAPVKFVDRGVAEGWITLENPRPVNRPGGPPSNPWLKDEARGLPYLFMHCDAMTIAGARYRVLANPDKYGPDGEPVTGDDGYADTQTHPDTRVDMFYDLELEG